MTRRALFRIGAATGVGLGLTAVRGVALPYLGDRGLLSADGAFGATSMLLSDLFYVEAFPTSPLILSPFSDALTVPRALAPVPTASFSSWASPPGPAYGQQNSMWSERHQIWPSQIGYPDPIVYKINLQVGQHAFTTSKVLPIDSHGHPTVSFDAGRQVAAGTVRTLPASTIYGFNGTLQRAAAAGASDIFPKDGSLADVLSAVRSARVDNLVVHPSLLRRLAMKPAQGPLPTVSLTPREQDVLTLMADGQDSAQIARRLGISLLTCRGYVKSLLTKLDAHSQLEAVVMATRLGLVRVGEHRRQ